MSILYYTASYLLTWWRKLDAYVTAFSFHSYQRSRAVYWWTDDFFTLNQGSLRFQKSICSTQKCKNNRTDQLDSHGCMRVASNRMPRSPDLNSHWQRITRGQTQQPRTQAVNMSTRTRVCLHLHTRAPIISRANYFPRPFLRHVAVWHSWAELLTRQGHKTSSHLHTRTDCAEELILPAITRVNFGVELATGSVNFCVMAALRERGHAGTCSEKK